MIVAEMKPLSEIKEMIEPYEKVLVLGCGSCVTVCLTGGRRQVELLASALRATKKAEGREITIGERTIPRQCEPKFVDQIKEDASRYDVILSMACGIGVQGIVDRLRKPPVLPAMNTTFLGMADEGGNFHEVCLACGNCLLAFTGGICPVARCAKSLVNGPCGGSRGGLCEASKDNPCVWQLIYNRLKELDMLHLLKEMSHKRKWPVHPQKMIKEDPVIKKEQTKGA